jgi:tetratricopeptide (TPR) repeat protein
LAPAIGQDADRSGDRHSARLLPHRFDFRQTTALRIGVYFGRRNQMRADRKRPLALPVPRKAATGALRFAAVAGVVSILMPPQQSMAVTMPVPGGPSISAPTFTPSPRPAPPPVAPGPGGPSYTPPPVYQPSPAELQQQRATAINEQGMTLFKRGDYAGAVRLFEQAFALSTNPNYAQLIKRNIAASYSWLTREAQERGDFDQALRYIQLAQSYYAGDPDKDWPGWERFLRDKIREQQEAIATAERERQELARTVATNAEQERAEARAKIAAAIDAQKAAIGAEAEKQRADAKKKIAEQLAASQFAKTDRVAPVDVPPPHLDAKAWSTTFPGEKTQAAFQLSQSSFDKLREAKLHAADWITDQLREKGKEKAIETVMEHLPFSHAINREIERQHDLIERYKELHDERSKSATEYVTGFFEVAHGWVACEAGGGAKCADTASTKLEMVSNKYADQEGKRWWSWWLEDIRSHGESE